MAKLNNDHSVSRQSLKLGYEPENVRVGAILRFVIGLSVATALAFALVAGLLKVLSYQQAEEDARSVTPLTMQYGEQKPPAPYLQLAPYSHIHPLDEYKERKKQWDITLRRGGKDQNGIERIPIEQAKQMLLQQGLPVRNQQQPQPGAEAQGEKQDMRFDDVPSFQSSGRVTERRVE
jgi:hypothetical protein